MSTNYDSLSTFYSLKMDFTNAYLSLIYVSNNTLYQ